MRPRPLFPASVAAFAAVSLLASGCGGASPTTAATTAAIRPSSTLAYVRCMRSNGVPNFPDPTSSGEIPKDKVVALVGGPQFAAAQRACQHVIPATGLGPQETPQQMRTRFADALAFSRCIRRHGFSTFPDPTSSGELTHEMLANAGINLAQPAAVQAGDACVGVTHGLITKAGVARFIAGH
jgi:hypothetical protein